MTALIERLPATSTRVEKNTKPEINETIRRRDNAEIARFEDASEEEIAERLRQLDTEWDVERLLQANASTLALTGVLLGFKVDKRFFLLSTTIYTFFLQHALQGWCPPIPIFRRLGVRTAREIERERYALKALRGDFDALVQSTEAEPKERVRAVLRAIDS
jgi:hypothetical protein